ncbi:MAG: phosphoribosylglycinamide formyltransferase [Clostridia bacterium]|nr:phosphoribosylglycinamide formyltransferase [Clostridia bacterium]
MRVKIAVLVSGGGTNMQAVIDEINSGNINGDIEIVISSSPDAFALKRAESHGIEGIYIGKDNYPDVEERTEAIIKILEDHEISLVILAGYMSILDKKMVKRFQNQIINIHPSLIPSFCGKGYYGKKVHQAVLDYGAKLTGATVHFVDEGTDTGPVILQKSVEVKQNETVETLAKKVLDIEHQLLPKAVKLYCENKLVLDGRTVKIKEV